MAVTGTGKGTHVSVYMFFKRGKFDGSLKWPFRGTINKGVGNTNVYCSH